MPLCSQVAQQISVNTVRKSLLLGTESIFTTHESETLYENESISDVNPELIAPHRPPLPITKYHFRDHARPTCRAGLDGAQADP
jgi:hypothetical protein